MEEPEPASEHLWLQQLVGNWKFEADCSMGPGQPPTTSSGREIVRPLGKLWTIGEGSVGTPDGGSCDSVTTLGYDPQVKKFVGSYVASVMTHFWPYEGALDSTGKILTLDSNGPSFAGDGTMASYQDIIEFVTDDHRILTSRVLGPDGNWYQFMTAHYHRQT